MRNDAVRKVANNYNIPPGEITKRLHNTTLYRSLPRYRTHFKLAPVLLQTLTPNLLLSCHPHIRKCEFQFLHFNAEHGKLIAVLDKSVPGKHCQELYCAVHKMLKSFSIFRLICIGNKLIFVSIDRLVFN